MGINKLYFFWPPVLPKKNNDGMKLELYEKQKKKNGWFSEESV